MSPIQERPVDGTAVTGMPFSNDESRDRSPRPLTSDGSDAVCGGRTTSGRGLEADGHAIARQLVADTASCQNSKQK